MLSEPTNETKRNSGRTGATSEAGRATSARNATRHGMCTTTLILEHELESDWQDLLQTWLKAYQSPAESTLLYTFVLKTAQSEWHRLRVQPNAASSANTASSNTTGKHTANQSPHGRPPPEIKAETGKSAAAQDSHYPPPPTGWKPIPIPGPRTRQAGS